MERVGVKPHPLVAWMVQANILRAKAVMKRDEFLIHTYFDENHRVYRWVSNHKVPAAEIQRKAGVQEEIIQRSQAIREVETTLGMPSVTTIEEPVALTFRFSEALALKSELRRLVLAGKGLSTYAVEKLIERLNRRIKIIYERNKKTDRERS